MGKDFSELKKIFNEYKEQLWYFVEPGGNQGDQIIYAGAYKLADEVGLKYKKLHQGKKAKVDKLNHNAVIYIHGGGGWNAWWNWTPRMVKMLREKNPKQTFIIGPSTVALQDWYIDCYLPENVVFFCREKTSYNYMKKKLEDVRIEHDTALYLEKDDKYLSPFIRKLNLEPFKLAAIRVDAESPDQIPSSVNLKDYDLVVDPCYEKNRWGALHYYASEILTNRSHSAILGAILGKPVKMFKGKYHKNRSIYEYSLQDMGVEWVE